MVVINTEMTVKEGILAKWGQCGIAKLVENFHVESPLHPANPKWNHRCI